MKDFIDKRLKIGKVFGIIVLALFVLEFPLVVLNPIVSLAFSNVVIILGLIYLGAYMPYARRMKWLKKIGKEEVIYDIDLEKPIFRKKKIYCGQKAIFSKSVPCAIIPYSEMAWVYVKETSVNGIKTGESIIVHTKDRKKFELACNRQEFGWLFDNYIAAQSPDVVVGYGKKQRQRFLELNPKRK